MLTKEEKNMIVTILTRFLMKETATYKEFEQIKKIVNKLMDEE